MSATIRSVTKKLQTNLWFNHGFSCQPKSSENFRHEKHFCRAIKDFTPTLFLDGLRGLVPRLMARKGECKKNQNHNLKKVNK
jgi:hypothetical protein